MRVRIRESRAAETRAALLAAARQAFAARGYHATGTPELAAEAGVTRGALYHHFRDKEDLFEAVFRQVAAELEAAASQAVRSMSDDPWRMLQQGLQAWLRLVAADADVQRILLIEGPVVFGWARWRDIQSEFTFVHLVRHLQALMEAGAIPRRPADALAHLMLAALNDAALSIAHARDHEAARAQVGEALAALVNGVRD